MASRYLSRLRLTNFRNYAHGALDLDARHVVLTGPTGVADDGTRRVRINGATARTVEQLSEYLRLLWLTPSMDGLFTGPAADRRRFLDRLTTTLIPSHS